MNTSAPSDLLAALKKYVLSTSSIICENKSQKEVLILLDSLRTIVSRVRDRQNKKPCKSQEIQFLFGDLSTPSHTAKNGCDIANNIKRIYCKLECILDLLDWLILQISETNSCEKVGHLLVYFISDFLSDSDIQHEMPIFADSRVGNRLSREHSRFLFEDAQKLCYFGCTHSATSSDIFGIMGLRQAIESKFNRMIGLAGLSPTAKFSHSLVVDIFREKWHADMFTDEKATKDFLLNVKTIVDWTNSIVHWTNSSPVWLLWKAFEYVAPLFKELPPPTLHDNPDLMAILNAPGTKRLNSTIQLTGSELESLRESFVEKITKKSHKTKFIHWENPEAMISNSIGPLEATTDIEQWMRDHKTTTHLK